MRADEIPNHLPEYCGDHLLQIQSVRKETLSLLLSPLQSFLPRLHPSPPFTLSVILFTWPATVFYWTGVFDSIPAATCHIHCRTRYAGAQRGNRRNVDLHVRSGLRLLIRVTLHLFICILFFTHVRSQFAAHSFGYCQLAATVSLAVMLKLRTAIWHWSFARPLPQDQWIKRWLMGRQIQDRTF
jgi:hypothetical protein